MWGSSKVPAEHKKARIGGATAGQGEEILFPTSYLSTAGEEFCTLIHVKAMQTGRIMLTLEACEWLHNRAPPRLLPLNPSL